MKTKTKFKMKESGRKIYRLGFIHPETGAFEYAHGYTRDIARAEQWVDSTASIYAKFEESVTQTNEH